MDPLLTHSKADRRAKTRAMVLALPAAERARQAAALTSRILASPEWSAARRLLLFVPLADEIDLSALLPASLAEGKTVGLPAFDTNSGTYVIREIRNPTGDLVPGRFHIPEPSAACPLMTVAELDYLVVPGLAFDARGGRLGRGEGFYDRLLARATGLLCGVGFDEQFGAAVPVESHDLTMHRILTATKSHDCRLQL